ncbi:MAG: PilZ domain-containing protein [Deltaproteobacteria bacterium]|nr:PilZ domain-containing protein [Deltaproteobacteria bacterium]
MSINGLIERLEYLQGRDQHVGQEKRKFVRLIYPPPKRPLLKVRNYEVEVVDISERGIRLFNYMQHEFDKNIQGMVVFQNGTSLEVNGEIVWQFKNELGLLGTHIPRIIIEKEAYNLSRYFQEKLGGQY